MRSEMPFLVANSRNQAAMGVDKVGDSAVAPIRSKARTGFARSFGDVCLEFFPDGDARVQNPSRFLRPSLNITGGSSRKIP
jgi:hypothetical protein